MNKNLFVTSLLCLLGVCAWADPNAGALQEPTEGEALAITGNPFVQPAAVVGNDDRVNITGQGVGPEQAVVVLEMKTPQGTGGCSGSLIAPNVVLTAAHCLHMNGSYVQAVNVFAPGLSEDGSDNQIQNPSQQNPGKVQKPKRKSGEVLPGIRLPDERTEGNKPSKELQEALKAVKKKKASLPLLPDFSETKVEEKVIDATQAVEPQLIDNVFEGRYQTFAAQARQAGVPSAQGIEMWVPEEWKHAPHNTPDLNKFLNEVERYDYGLIILAQGNELGRKIKPLRIAESADSSLQNMGLVVIGRGGDKPKRTLWKGEGMIELVKSFFFMHTADMMQGNSGGPAMLISDRRTIIGLNNFHLGNAKQREGAAPNGCLRINDKIIIAVEDAKAGKPLTGSSKTDKPRAKRSPRANPKVRHPNAPKAPKAAPKKGTKSPGPFPPLFKSRFGTNF